jgi:hypothetical protein
VPTHRQPPDEQEWAGKLCSFYTKLIRNCWRFHGSVISGIRSPSRNMVVGGKLDSRHLLGLAADVVYDSIELREEAWVEGRAAGMHGYKKGMLTIHWQDRGAPPPQ